MASSTRRPTPLDIYQDPVTSTSTSHSQHHDVESALLQALGPSNNASGNKQGVVLEPSRRSPTRTSPRKSDQRSSSPAPGPLAGRSLNSIYLPPPTQSNFNTDSPQKHFTKQTSTQMHPSAVQHMPEAYFANFIPPSRNVDKENMLYHQQSYSHQHPHQVRYADPAHGFKAPLKRTAADLAPLSDVTNTANSAKKIKTAKSEEPQASFTLPDPSELPDVEDDGTKPAHSYATLIAMSILRAPNRRLTLAQIYKWISDHFKFYRASETGWQNSIRHNLSLNKAFIKQERPKDDPGKGNYWAIQPGEERGFLNKERPLRKLAPGDNATFLQATQHDFGSIGRPMSTPAIGHFTLAPPHLPSSNAHVPSHPFAHSSATKRFENKAVDSTKFPDDSPSSDGTIPASDPALNEDEQDALAMPPPAARHIRSSPPPEDDIRSSPPPMLSDRQGTPPGLPRYPSSRSGGRTNKFKTGMNDSGYYSSIESSVTRGPGYTNMVPTSEADDRPRIKRGRAEEEIARIRSSSYDSPSKDHGRRRKISVHFEETSSPHKRNGSSGNAPATPGPVIFKRPAIPPPTISPNTNLKDHRARMQKLLGETPSRKHMTPLRESYTSWSPHYSVLDTDSFASPSKTTQMTPWRDALFNSAFDVIDYHTDDLAARGSPGKKQRPKMERAVTTSGILADITGNNTSRSNAYAGSASVSTSMVESPFNLSFSPFKMTPEGISQQSPVKFGSPMKRTTMALPSTLMQNNENAPQWLDLSMDHFFESNDFNHPPPLRQPNIVGSNGHDFGMKLPSDGSEEGFDILQEFGKIGAQIGAQRYAQPSQGSPVKRGPARPPLGRSVTSRF